MFNIFRRRNARNDPSSTQAAAVTKDSKWRHTLHLLASGGAGVEGAWQEYLAVSMQLKKSHRLGTD